MLAPIIIFAYNRKQHLEKTLKALENNRLVEDTDVYLFADAARDESDKPKVIEVREYIEDYSLHTPFCSMKVSYADQHKGLAKSVIQGVTEIISKHKKAIVVEDDLITSIDFLEFMNGALDYYENDKRIWAISGYTMELDGLKSYDQDVYLGYRMGSWGWATWENRWGLTDWEVLDYKDFKFNFFKRNAFNRGGYDLADMLDMQMRGDIDSWAVRWGYAQSKLSMLTVYPSVSRVSNIGNDGSGTHCGATDEFNTYLFDGSQMCRFTDLQINRQLTSEFRDRLSLPLYRRIRRGVKSLLLRLIK